MIIVHVITRLILGGAQKNTVMCCCAQKQAGHEVTLIHGPIYGPEGSLLEQARSSGVRVIELPQMCREIRPLRDLRCYFALCRLLKKLKPHVVHTHSSKAGILGRAAAWKQHVPLIVHTIHGLPFHDRQSRWRHQMYVAAERWAARRCHKLVGITRAMVDAFEQKKIGHSAQFVVIPSGVSVSDFDPRQQPPREVTRKAYHIPPDAPVIGIVARLDPLKGHDDLLDVYADLQKRFADLHLLFVGDGWHREALEARVARTGWEQRVIFAGLVNPSQIPSLIGAMDIMVLPSYQEGQGRTLVESLLCQCPVVGYDVGGIGEVCIDHQTGRLVPPGDKNRLAQALEELLANPQERCRLAQQGRKHVETHFSSQIMFDQLQKLYHLALPVAEESV